MHRNKAFFRMKKYLVFWTLILSFLGINKLAQAQEKHVVQWEITAQKLDAQTLEMSFEASILESGWHFWSLQLQNEMLIPTKIEYQGLQAQQIFPATLSQGELIEREDELFGTISYYEGDRVILKQKIKIDNQVKNIKGSLTFQACNASMCVAPQTIPFDIDF